MFPYGIDKGGTHIEMLENRPLLNAFSILYNREKKFDSPLEEVFQKIWKKTLPNSYNKYMNKNFDEPIRECLGLINEVEFNLEKLKYSVYRNKVTFLDQHRPEFNGTIHYLDGLVNNTSALIKIILEKAA